MHYTTRGESVKIQGIFLEDLKKLIDGIKEETDMILIAGDLNEQVKSREGSNNKICEMGFINILQWQYGDVLPPTRHPGREAIDHIYISPALLNLTKYAGFLPFGSGITSDHRPIFIDLELDNMEQVERKFTRRNLVSTHPTRQKKYNTFLEEKYTAFELTMKLLSFEKRVDADPTNIKFQKI